MGLCDCIDSGLVSAHMSFDFSLKPIIDVYNLFDDVQPGRLDSRLLLDPIQDL